jgi:hypothetical protein
LTFFAHLVIFAMEYQKSPTPNFTIPFATKSCFKLNNFHKKCINSLKEIYILKNFSSIKLGKLASYGRKSLYT